MMRAIQHFPIRAPTHGMAVALGNSATDQRRSAAHCSTRTLQLLLGNGVPRTRFFDRVRGTPFALRRDLRAVPFIHSIAYSEIANMKIVVIGHGMVGHKFLECLAECSPS